MTGMRGHRMHACSLGPKLCYQSATSVAIIISMT